MGDAPEDAPAGALHLPVSMMGGKSGDCLACRTAGAARVPDDCNGRVRLEDWIRLSCPTCRMISARGLVLSLRVTGIPPPTELVVAFVVEVSAVLKELLDTGASAGLRADPVERELLKAHLAALASKQARA